MMLLTAIFSFCIILAIVADLELFAPISRAIAARRAAKEAAKCEYLSLLARIEASAIARHITPVATSRYMPVACPVSPKPMVHTFLVRV